MEDLRLQTDHDTAGLFRLISENRFPHALIIEAGEHLSGRALALRLAQGLCCEDGGPCLACPSCLKAAKGVHPDITLIEGEKQISIEAIRSTLIKTITLRPNESEKKVYIIDLLNGITLQAQNALLKSLEEPPANVHIIIVCPDAAALLETVRSRCVCVTLKGSAAFSESAMEHAQSFAHALTQKDEFSGYGFAVKLSQTAKGELRDVVACLGHIFSKALKDKVACQNGGAISGFSAKRLANCVEICDKYLRMLPQNINPDTVAAALFVEIWEELH